MKTLITAVILSASLALGGNVAMAAPTHVHKTAATHVTRHVAKVQRNPVAWQQPGLGPFFGGFLGLPFPITTYAGPGVTIHAGRSSGRDTYVDNGYTPPDTSLQDSIGWANQQMSIDAANQASQEITQEANDMAASNAAAAAQNALADDMNNTYMMNQLNSQ